VTPIHLTHHASEEDLAYQEQSLQAVSRTFALTIPQLPGRLRTLVGNAYLLCRIADTIEDSDTLTLEEKRRFYQAFVEAVAGTGSPQAFGADLAPRLQDTTTEGERDLIRNTPAVLRITHSFSEQEQAALTRCLRIMSQGMEEFQEGQFSAGLRDLPHMDAYCYHVAGVVGEMLTELFCSHSSDMARHRNLLMRLSVSFGQGLQMTNILKDIWDDKSRDVCWLPRGLFAVEGYDLGELSAAASVDARYQQGLAELIGVARGHLENALRYTLLIPKSEVGIRNFCLWAIGMAVLTLRKINRNRAFTSGKDVKISRRSVYATVFVTRWLGWSNWLLRQAFRLLARPLPKAPPSIEA
jgi:farnesyl-diphosphate farnesyltransferase